MTLPESWSRKLYFRYVKVIACVGSYAIFSLYFCTVGCGVLFIERTSLDVRDNEIVNEVIGIPVGSRPESIFIDTSEWRI